MVPTLAPHAASQSWDSHVPEDILYVLPRPKSQDRDTREFFLWGAFSDMAGAAASVRFVVSLKVATVCAASAVSCNLCSHRQLN